MSNIPDVKKFVAVYVQPATVTVQTIVQVGNDMNEPLFNISQIR